MINLRKGIATFLPLILAFSGCEYKKNTEETKNAQIEVMGDKQKYSRSLEEMGNKNIEETIKSGVYCIRNVVWYESLVYDDDKTIKKTRSKVTIHGSGFSVKSKDGWYYILTNNHVANLPEVIKENNRFVFLRLGSRKLEERITIVDNEKDDYVKDDILLEKIVVDKKNDVALLRTKEKLNVTSYKIGKSSDLKEGDIVLLGGFPLGLVKAITYGKVNSMEYKDINVEEGDNHLDFIVDLSANPGNSGSPVFTVLKDSNELALVGVYHAAYESGTGGLKLVIGVDNFVKLLENLKAEEESSDGNLKDENYEKIIKFVKENKKSNVYQIGNRLGFVDILKDGIKLTLYSENYPLDNISVVELYDYKPFGDLDEVIIGDPKKKVKKGIKDVPDVIADDIQNIYHVSCNNFLDLINYWSLLARSQSSKGISEECQIALHRINKNIRDQRSLVDSLDYGIEKLLE